MQLTSSIVTSPDGSAKRNSAVMRELFPAPVLPTIPIYGGNVIKEKLQNYSKKYPDVVISESSVLNMTVSLNYGLAFLFI